MQRLETKTQELEAIGDLADRLRPHVEKRGTPNTWIGVFIHTLAHNLSGAYSGEYKNPHSTSRLRLMSLESQVRAVENFPEERRLKVCAGCGKEILGFDNLTCTELRDGRVLHSGCRLKK